MLQEGGESGAYYRDFSQRSNKIIKLSAMMVQLNASPY